MKEELPEDLQAVVAEAVAAFADADAPAVLEQTKARYLGKSGFIPNRMKQLNQASVEQRPALGQAINAAKQAIEAALSAQRQLLSERQVASRLAAQQIDVTLPGRGHSPGAEHPVMRTWERIETLFASIGFDIADGPEIETDWYNFTALNQPADHPARSMHDTFYLESAEDTLLLRTHTSPMQVRYAVAHSPPIKVVALGKTYRVDSDATHSPMFHQVEGLWLEEGISFADLKGVYTNFIQQFFETQQVEVRFRPSFFPFTEPSAEIDIRFSTGPLKDSWLEISGAGQVHPAVVRNYGLDPERYVGFAFGSGLERLAMLRYGIGDLRLFFEGDLRFLQQFV